VVRGYKLVKATPIHEPATTFRRVEASPQITWGKIEGTMFLGVSDPKPSSFRVQDTPQRDELGMRMANTVNNKKRHLKEAEKSNQQAKLDMASGVGKAKPLSDAGKRLLTTLIRERTPLAKK